VKKVRCRSDSKLVIGQVNGDFQAKDTQMHKYYHLTMCLLSCFDEYELKHIFRENNDRANVLAKLASSKKSRQHRTFIQKALITPSIDKYDIFASKLVVTLGSTQYGIIL